MRLNGDPCENRTRVSSVTGRCNKPLYERTTTSRVEHCKEACDGLGRFIPIERMVCVAGFEPASSPFQTELSTRLTYTQMKWSVQQDLNLRLLAPKASGLPD